MADQLLETRTPDQLARLTSITPEALITVQEEGGPVGAIAIKSLLGRLIQTDTVKETRADLFADLDHDDAMVALVFADPDPAKNGWYRKVGDSGEGIWQQFEKLSDQAAAEIAEYVEQASNSADVAVAARDAVQSLANFRKTIAEGIADFAVGEFFSSTEGGDLRLYERIAAPPYYDDLGDETAPLTRAKLANVASGPLLMNIDQSLAYDPGSIGDFVIREIDVTKPPFNAVGVPMAANEKALLQSAYALAEALNVPLFLGKDKTYHLGTMSGTVEEVVFGGKGPPKIYGENVKLTAANHAVTPQVAYIFSWANFRGKVVQGITVEGTNQASWADIVGLAAFNVRKLAGGASGLILRNVAAKNVMRGFGVLDVGADPAERVTGIRFEDFRIENCYYGLNFQDDGDDVSGTITITNARRAYFAYGVADHDVDVFVKVVAGGNTLGSTGCILLGRIHRRDMGAMKVRVTFSGDLNRYDALFYNMNNTTDLAGTLGGVVGQIDFRGDLDSTATAGGSVSRYQLLSYIKNQSTETAGLPNVWQGVTLRGNFLDTGQGSAGVAVKVAAPPAGLTYITLDPDTRISNWFSCILAPNIVFRLASNREVRCIKGAGVHGAVFNIPLGHQGRSYSLRHSLYAHDASAGFGNSTIREDIILGTVASPSGIPNTPKVIAVIAPDGAGATRIVPTFGGVAGAGTVTLSAAAYATANAFAKLETIFVGEMAG